MDIAVSNPTDGIIVPYEVNDHDPLQGMEVLAIPSWILRDEQLNLKSKVILAFILFRAQLRGETTISYRALQTIGDCKRSSVSEIVNMLNRRQYILIRHPGKGGGKSTYLAGPRSLEKMSRDSASNIGIARPEDGLIPSRNQTTPIQKMDAPCPDSGLLPSNKRTTPVQKMDAYINKEKNKQIEEGEGEFAPSCFLYSEVKMAFGEYAKTPQWSAFSPENQSANIVFLQQLEREGRCVALASIQYTLRHGYSGFYINDEIRETAKRMSSAHVPSGTLSLPRGKKGETDNDFYLISRDKAHKNTDFQLETKNKWADCLKLVPEDLQSFVFDDRVHFIRQDEALVIEVPHELYVAMNGMSLPPFEHETIKLKEI